jgi:hypothetical protein
LKAFLRGQRRRGGGGTHYFVEVVEGLGGGGANGGEMGEGFDEQLDASELEVVALVVWVAQEDAHELEEDEAVVGEEV